MSSTQGVNKPFLIGVDIHNNHDKQTPFKLPPPPPLRQPCNAAGGTASGKSTVCEEITAKLAQDCQRRVAIIKQDSFYKKLTEEELAQAKTGLFNFDHPSAIDDKAMYEALKDIKAGKPIKLPIHDYHDNQPKPDLFYEVNQADVVLFEGVLIFYFPEVREMFHMKLFVDTDSDTRLSRRVLRDVRERGRQLEHVLFQYDTHVKPAFEEFCQPTKKYADMIIPRGAENQVAIGLINHNVTYLLSSEIPAQRKGQYRPMHLRAASPQTTPPDNLCHPQPVLNLSVCSSSPPGMPNVISPTTTSPSTNSSPAHRSRSNSHVSFGAALAAARRLGADIKKEQNANLVQNSQSTYSSTSK